MTLESVLKELERHCRSFSVQCEIEKRHRPGYQLEFTLWDGALMYSGKTLEEAFVKWKSAGAVVPDENKTATATAFIEGAVKSVQ